MWLVVSARDERLRPISHLSNGISPKYWHYIPPQRLLACDIAERVVGVKVIVHGPLALAGDELAFPQQERKGGVEVAHEERRALAHEEVDGGGEVRVDVESESRLAHDDETLGV